MLRFVTLIFKRNLNDSKTVVFSLTEEAEDDKNENVEVEIDLLFDLCKEDFPSLSSQEPTINVGVFLTDLQTTGIRRDDKRLANLMAELNKLKDQDSSFGPSVDNLNLNKDTFKRYQST